MAFMHVILTGNTRPNVAANPPTAPGLTGHSRTDATARSACVQQFVWVWGCGNEQFRSILSFFLSNLLGNVEKEQLQQAKPASVFLYGSAGCFQADCEAFMCFV